jgi:hypothetical protein
METVCFSEALVSTYEPTRRHNPEERTEDGDCFSETFVSTYKSTRRHNPEEHHNHLHRHENLKCHTAQLY